MVSLTLAITWPQMDMMVQKRIWWRLRCMALLAKTKPALVCDWFRTILRDLGEHPGSLISPCAFEQLQFGPTGNGL
jgi:hypothetical protein